MQGNLKINLKVGSRTRCCLATAYNDRREKQQFLWKNERTVATRFVTFAHWPSFSQFYPALVHCPQISMANSIVVSFFQLSNILTLRRIWFSSQTRTFPWKYLYNVYTFTTYAECTVHSLRSIHHFHDISKNPTRKCTKQKMISLELRAAIKNFFKNLRFR